MTSTTQHCGTTMTSTTKGMPSTTVVLDKHNYYGQYYPVLSPSMMKHNYDDRSELWYCGTTVTSTTQYCGTTVTSTTTMTSQSSAPVIPRPLHFPLSSQLPLREKMKMPLGKI